MERQEREQAEDMMFDADGVDIAYRLEGAGTRRLVCVHGVGSSLRTWDGVAELLRPHFRILRFDLRGHGGSARIKGRYEIDDFVKDLFLLADHVGFPTFDLVGSSLGGLIAQRAALARGNRIERLVLLSTVAGRNAIERERVAHRLELLKTREPGFHHDDSASRWFTDAFRKANPELMIELRERNALNDPECYAAAYRVLAETDLGDQLDRIACPTLVATGEEDQGSNPRMARLMHERISGSRLEILPGLRHSILIEAPSLVAGLLLDFLQPDNATSQPRPG